MSELALTLLRLSFLFLLWVFVFLVVSALRRDLAAPSSTPVAGASIPPPTQQRHARRRAKHTASKLVVVEGTLAGTVIPLGSSPVSMGRAADCTVVLDDDYASSHHCRIYPHEDAWVVEDLGSTNGTWIDRTRVTGPTALAMGQPLRIGRTVVELRS